MNVTTQFNNIELLEYKFRRKVQAWLADLMSQRIYVVVLETYRTPDRQQYLYDRGKTTTTKGKHPKGLAIDVAPVCRFKDGKVREVTWKTEALVWRKIAAIAAMYNIAWGGDWESFPDYVHFEEPTL